MIYTIASLFLGIIFAYALSGYFAALPVFLIVFGSALCLLTFMDNIKEGTNWYLNAIFSIGEADDELWFLVVILFLIGLPIAVISSPICYFVSETEEETTKNILFGVVVAFEAFLFIVGLLLFIKPILIYKLISYGWIIFALIVLTVISLVFTIVLICKEYIETQSFWLMLVSCIICIPLIIVGIVTSKNHTYEIYSASDMSAFANIPDGYGTLFVLKNDIDFEGEDVSWYGKKDEFSGVFDGGGYTLSNIHYAGDVSVIEDHDSEYTCGFVGVNKGVIKNLNFENCTFDVNFYIEETYQNGGFGIAAGLNDSGSKLYNCTVTNCYIKYNSSSAKVGYIIGLCQKDDAYDESGALLEDGDIHSNKVIIDGMWVPESDFFDDSVNYVDWTKAKPMYGGFWWNAYRYGFSTNHNYYAE